MPSLFEQVAGILLAVALMPLLFYFPGRFLLCRVTWLRALLPPRAGAALLLSISLLPIAYHLLRGVVGEAFFGVLLLGAVVFSHPGQIPLAAFWDRSRRWMWAGLGGWLALVVVLNLDIPWNGGLYTHAMAFDWAKHVLVADALARTGASPVNPTLYPGEALPLCYYYLWHQLAALLCFVPGGGSWLTPRAVMVGSVFWAGLGLFAVFNALLSAMRSVAGNATETPRWRGALLWLLPVGGFASALLAVRVALFLNAGVPLRLDFLSVLHTGSEPVFSLLNTVLTSPHHAAALVCVLTGFLLLRQAMELSLSTRRLGWVAVLAGMSFASAGGMSIWVGLTAAVVAAAWVVTLLLRRDGCEAGLWLASGIAAALAIAPLFIALHRGNHLTGAPLAFAVRSFTFTHLMVAPWKAWADLLLLPLNYLIELGFPLIAAWLAWRLWRQNVALTRNELFLRVMFWSSLLFVSFVASAVRHNDLGWRGMLFAQTACLLWSWPIFASLFARMSGTSARLAQITARCFPRLWKFALLALGIGWCSTLLDVGMIRFAPVFLDATWLVTDAPHSGLGLPDDHHTAERMAAYYEGYEWLRRHSSRDARMALSADIHTETPFYLYANRQAIVTDLYNSTLFGIRRDEYEQLRRQMAPLVAAPPLPWAEVCAVLKPLGADYLILRSGDPAWSHSRPWPEPVFRNGYLAIYRIREQPPLNALPGQ